MIFYKTVASGNDFIHIDVRELNLREAGMDGVQSLQDLKSSIAKRICDRHRGAGADGVVYYHIRQPHEEETPVVDIEIFNRDGSEAELSGNGMAGVTSLLFYLDKASDHVTLQTKVGLRTHWLVKKEGHRFQLNIEIGAPDFNARHFFPFLEEEQLTYRYQGVSFYPVSVGNPHAVVVLEEETPEEELLRMGKMLVEAPIFPMQTNVEFVVKHRCGDVNFETGEHFNIFFYERGVGPTQASSTGSSAVYAVLQRIGAVKEKIFIPQQVSSPGSRPKRGVTVSGTGNIYIENSVEMVYKGIYLQS